MSVYTNLGGKDILYSDLRDWPWKQIFNEWPWGPHLDTESEQEDMEDEEQVAFFGGTPLKKRELLEWPWSVICGSNTCTEKVPVKKRIRRIRVVKKKKANAKKEVKSEPES